MDLTVYRLVQPRGNQLEHFGSGSSYAFRQSQSGLLGQCYFDGLLEHLNLRLSRRIRVSSSSDHLPHSVSLAKSTSESRILHQHSLHSQLVSTAQCRTDCIRRELEMIRDSSYSNALA
jgi:hypothetical protein